MNSHRRLHIHLAILAALLSVALLGVASMLPGGSTARAQTPQLGATTQPVQPVGRLASMAARSARSPAILQGPCKARETLPRPLG